MARLYLDQLKPGMVLISDAKHHSGQVLLKAGVELTEKHLRIFRTWGLTEADVEGEDVVQQPSLADIDQTIIDRAEAILQARCRHVDLTHPAMAELKYLAICTLARKLAEEAES